jgi:hypothetical protein
MKLLTKEIKEAAAKQYPKGSSMEDQMVVAKFFNPVGAWTWYLMNVDPSDPDYAWGIVKGFEVEMGSWSMNELQSLKLLGGLGIERDISFRPIPATEVWDRLNKGEHV